MKKRLLSALLALCMVLTMAPAVAFAAGGDGSASTGYGANLDDITVGVDNPDAVGAPEDAPVAELKIGSPDSAAININKTGATNMVYNIGEDTVLMISGQGSAEPIVFENCTFNLSGGTDRISGSQDGISYNNGDTITKLWIGGNVQFENCKFVTEPGATKTTSAGNDACIYFFSGDIQLDNCLLQAEGYNGQFLGLYGSEGAVTFNNCDIGTVNNKNGWSYAMYGGSVLKLNKSTMTATGMSIDSGNTNAFYSGDNKTGYDAISVKDSIIDFSDNEAGGFAINNVNIHVDNSQITVSDNLGNACNSGYWIVNNSDITMNGNRGGHALSCIGFEMTGSDVEILHNGYAGVYIQSRDSSLTNCEVDIRCNGEKLLSYTAGDIWLNGHTLTVDNCTSEAQPGSAWLGGVGRKGAVKTAEGTSVVAYDLNSNAADNLKSSTKPVLTNATLALNGTEDQHTLLLNPFMETAYARGNGEKNSNDNDADLFADDKVTSPSDILGSDNAKIGQLTDAQLSHHIYDWNTAVETQAATADTYGFAKYACTECDGYTSHTADHVYSFDCDATYVYAPLVGVTYVANAGTDEVTNMPAEADNLAYGTVPETSIPERESGAEDWSWTFTGWYTDANCTRPLDKTTGLTDNWTTLYAGWKRTAVPQYEEPTIDKTATDLDGNDRTDVTLTVGATEDMENVAVMFLLDKSTSQGMRDEAAEMLDELKTKTNTNILYDVVIFSGTAQSTGWQDIQDDTTLDEIKAEFVNGETTSGTNMSAGIWKAKSDMETLAEEYPEYITSYLVALSDGITYVWSEADDGEVKCVPVEGLGAKGQVETTAQNGADTWAMMYEYGTSLQNIYGGVENFLDAMPDKMDATRNDGHVQDYYGENSLDNPITTYIYDDLATAGVAAQYASGPDFAMYYAVTGYAELANMFTNTFAYAVPELDGSGNDNTANWDNYPWGREIMEYCQSISSNAGWDSNISNTDAAKIFEGIKNQILYAIQKGIVNDVIGENFNMTYEISKDTFALTVGGEPVPATRVEGDTVYFGTPDDTETYPYAVTYYPNGKEGDSREQFDWYINVPVQNSAALQLTYSLTLVNKEGAAGTYTESTNEEATLDYETTTGGNGTLEFPEPEVSYTVGTITITPVDVTLYIGGTSSYWEDIAGGQIPNADSGIPAPHFYISGASDEQIANMTFHGTGSDGTEKMWVVEPYGGEGAEQATGENGQKVWNIASANANAADASCLYFSDEACTEPVMVDNIQNNQYTHLYATISTSDQSGAGNTNLYAMAGGQRYELDYGVGDLTIRSVTNDATSGQDYLFNVEHSSETDIYDVQNDTVAAAAATQDGTEAGVVVPVGTGYTVNGKENWTLVGNNTSLLFDDVLSTYELGEEGNEEVGKTMLEEAVIDNAEELGLTDMSGRQYESKYFDLVDAADGNVWVKADNQIVVYWPYPEGITSSNADEYDFDLFHFTGMHREYERGQDEAQELVDQAAANINNHGDYDISNDTVALMVEDIELTDHGIQFIVDQDAFGFSPFVLTWVAKDDGDSDGGNHGSGGNKPDDLNTEDHFAYIIGYPKDYRTGEPTDNESLWPVEPQGDITRAEVATIFFRMLTDDARDRNWSQTNDFTDVPETAWYNNAISTLANMGILSGDPDGSFRPDDSITRAEFTKIAVSFFEVTGDYVDGTYSDVPANAWYADFIDAAVDLGLIEGYPDGTIRPQASITRAEACTIVNRTLGRVPDKDHLLLEDEMRVWPDNSDTDVWYYAQIQEATNSHDYEWIGEEGDQIENWTDKLADRDWAALEDEWSDANSAPGGEVVD